MTELPVRVRPFNDGSGSDDDNAAGREQGPRAAGRFDVVEG